MYDFAEGKQGMKSRRFHRQASFVLILLCCIYLTGCSGRKKAEEVCPYKEFIVVDVLDLFANYQGVQSGWFGEIVKKKFNMQLNIITPNPDKPEKHNTKILPVRLLIRSRIFIAINCIKM